MNPKDFFLPDLVFGTETGEQHAKIKMSFLLSDQGLHLGLASPEFRSSRYDFKIEKGCSKLHIHELRVASKVDDLDGDEQDHN